MHYLGALLCYFAINMHNFSLFVYFTAISREITANVLENSLFWVNYTNIVLFVPENKLFVGYLLDLVCD